MLLGSMRIRRRAPGGGGAAGSRAARTRRRPRRPGCGGGLLRLPGAAGAAALQLVDAGVGGDEALAQLLVLLVQAAQLDDDLVEEVVDLVLVVALAELRRLEPLVDYVFRSQGHAHLVTLELRVQRAIGLTLRYIPSTSTAVPPRRIAQDA